MTNAGEALSSLAVPLLAFGRVSDRAKLELLFFAPRVCTTGSSMRSALITEIGLNASPRTRTMSL